MQTKDIIKDLCEHSEFKNWKKENKDCYLVHVFKMLDEPNEGIWQIGYYNKEKDKITTFFIEKDDIKVIPEEEAYKRPKSIIKELKIDKVKTSMEEAMEKANEIMKKEYSQEQPVKTILILQNIKEGLVWNITFVTQSFKTLNIKISAETGKVVSHELISLMQFNAG